MDFRRRLSSGGESFSEGTSRFFSSMIAKKNGLMNDLSNKIESVGATLMKTSSSGSSFGDSEDLQIENDVKNDDAFESKSGEDKENSLGKVEIDTQEEKKSSPGRNKTEVKLIARVHRRQDSGSSESGSISGNEGNYSAAGANMSFDEPLYSPSKISAVDKPSTGVGPSWKGQNTPPNIAPPPYNPNKTGRRSSRSSTNSPKLSSGLSSGHSSDSEKYINEKIVGEERSKAPTFASTKRRSSTVDEMLFDGYVEPEPEIPKTETKVEINDNDIVFNKRKTLLPMGDLISFDEPELEDFHPKGIKGYKDTSNSKVKGREHSGEKSFPSVSSVDSSENEFADGGLYNQTSVESSEPEYERDHSRRLSSMGSDRSWSSNYSLDSQPDDLTVECMNFMKGFVDKIFNPREDTGQVEKAKFGELCQQVPGRQWFARYVNSQRVVSKKVDESIFFRLVQYFAVTLFECNEAEDYVPAKNLMNMCFTFYHESRYGKQKRKNFLYSYLREQSIWQSLRFWNAAFFDAVQNERARKPVCTSEDGHDSQNDDSMFQENITFGQLGTFTCNMRAFGLSKELCLEFLRKQSTIADLKPDQIKMLKDNIEKWKDH